MNRFIWFIAAGFVLLGLGMLSMAGMGFGDMPMMGMGIHLVKGFAFLLLSGAMFAVFIPLVPFMARYVRLRRFRCPACGCPVQPSWSYCPHCGTELRIVPGSSGSRNNDAKSDWSGKH